MANREQRQPIRLLWVFVFGFLFSLAVVGGFFVLFAVQAAGGQWTFWAVEPSLDQDTLFGIARNAVTLAAALGVGITLFFSYRRQQTTERSQELAVQAQETATKAQELATKTLQLTLEKHELERVSELRNRYARSAEQLASDKTAIQLAGIHSLVALSDDWKKIGNLDEQQVCISLLCSFTQGLSAHEDELQRAATGIITVRVSSFLERDKSWGTRRLELAGVSFPRMADVKLSGGMLSLTDCEIAPTRPVRLKIESGFLRIAAARFPRIRSGEFKGGEARLVVQNRGRTWFDDCKFAGTNVQIISEATEMTAFIFTRCTFEAGSANIILPSSTHRVEFNDCTFRSPTVVKVRSRTKSNIVLDFNDCVYEGDASSMSEDPRGAVKTLSNFEQFVMRRDEINAQNGRTINIKEARVRGEEA